MPSNTAPKIVIITLGDPSGIGPEVVVRALNRLKTLKGFIPVCIGSYQDIIECASRLKYNINLTLISSYNEISSSNNDFRTYILDPTGNKQLNIIKGLPNSTSGEVAVESVLAACSVLQSYPEAALITAPISKSAIQQGKYRYFKGHVEIFQNALVLAQGSIKNMLVTQPFSNNPLRMVHVTSHISLRQVSNFLLSDEGRDRIAKTIEITHLGLKGLGINQPRIAVTGFNPHLEEWEYKADWAQLGLEERESIKPIIDCMSDEGFLVFGPLPADSAYRHTRMGDFDCVISMFHDQSHIAANSNPTDFSETIICTIGLPFQRFSTSHGLALDIAEKFVADSKPIENCIKAIIN